MKNSRIVIVIYVLIILFSLSNCQAYKVNSTIKALDKESTIGILLPNIVIYNVKNIGEKDIDKLKSDFQNKVFEKLTNAKEFKGIKIKKLKNYKSPSGLLNGEKIKYILSSEYDFLEYGNDLEGLASIVLTGIPLDRGVQNLKMKLIDTYSDTTVWELEVKNGVLFSNHLTAYKGIIGYPTRGLKKIVKQ